MAEELEALTYRAVEVHILEFDVKGRLRIGCYGTHNAMVVIRCARKTMFGAMRQIVRPQSLVPRPMRPVEIVNVKDPLAEDQTSLCKQERTLACRCGGVFIPSWRRRHFPAEAAKATNYRS